MADFTKIFHESIGFIFPFFGFNLFGGEGYIGSILIVEEHVGLSSPTPITGFALEESLTLSSGVGTPDFAFMKILHETLSASASISPRLVGDGVKPIQMFAADILKIQLFSDIEDNQ